MIAMRGVVGVRSALDMSDKAPQTYVLHTVVIGIVLVVAMVVYLRHAWG
jgi:hypothetical protein